jgi:hypothetical protein
MIYSLLFCFWIGLNYLNGWNDQLQEMVHSLAFNSHPPRFLSTFQGWLLDIFGVLFTSFVVALAVGCFAYHWRYCKAWKYFVLGLAIRFFVPLAVILISLYRYPLSFIIKTIGESLDLRISILTALHIVAAIYASYLGWTYGRMREYADPRDEQLGYVGGVSKKIWALLTIAWNPIVRFVTRLSLVLMYALSANIGSPKSWFNTISCIQVVGHNNTSDTGVLTPLFTLIMVWGLATYIFLLGIAMLRKKERRFRWLSIILIFVVLPIVSLAIPLIRNRDWFF